MRKTSHSEVEAFLACERKHYYAYGKKLQSKYTSESLERGIMVHAGLAKYYTCRKLEMSHGEGVREAFADIMRLRDTSTAFDPFKLQLEVVGLLGQYFEYYKDDPIAVLDVETDYLIKITDDYSMPVKIDLIYQDLSTGEVVVTDHKVVYNLYSSDKADLYPQLPKYVGVLMSEGFKFDRLEYNQLCRRKVVSTGPRFVRLPVPISKARILQTLKEQIRAANRIKTLKERDDWEEVILRNTGACDMCSFKLLCEADLNDRPTADLMAFEYRPRTKRNELNN